MVSSKQDNTGLARRTMSLSAPQSRGIPEQHREANTTPQTLASGTSSQGLKAGHTGIKRYYQQSKKAKWKKIFANQISDNRLMFRIYNKFNNHNKNK